MIVLLSLSVILGNISFFVLGYNSFISGIIATIIPTLIIYVLRKDLIIDSLATGFIMTTIAFIVFAIMNQIQPGFIYQWWLFDQLSGVILLGVPLEDVIWFFTTGMFLGCIYEFWQGGRLVKMKGKNKKRINCLSILQIA